eukprot:gene2134-6021_t
MDTHFDLDADTFFNITKEPPPPSADQPALYLLLLLLLLLFPPLARARAEAGRRSRAATRLQAGWRGFGWLEPLLTSA